MPPQLSPLDPVIQSLLDVATVGTESKTLLQAIKNQINLLSQEDREALLLDILRSTALQTLNNNKNELAKKIIRELVILYMEVRALLELSKFAFIVINEEDQFKTSCIEIEGFVLCNDVSFLEKQTASSFCYVCTNNRGELEKPKKLFPNVNFVNLEAALFPVSPEAQKTPNKLQSIYKLSHQQLLVIASYTGFSPSLETVIERSMQEINDRLKVKIAKQLLTSIGGILSGILLMPLIGVGTVVGFGMAALSATFFVGGLYQIGLHCAFSPLTDKTGSTMSALQTVFLSALCDEFNSTSNNDAKNAVQLLKKSFTSADQRLELKELLLHIVDSMPVHDRLKCLKAMTDPSQPLCQLMDIRRRPRLDYFFRIKGPDLDRTKGMRANVQCDIEKAENECLNEGYKFLSIDDNILQIIQSLPQATTNGIEEQQRLLNKVKVT